MDPVTRNRFLSHLEFQVMDKVQKLCDFEKNIFVMKPTEILLTDQLAQYHTYPATLHKIFF
jgi:hypothetical protein